MNPPSSRPWLVQLPASKDSQLAISADIATLSYNERLLGTLYISIGTRFEQRSDISILILVDVYCFTSTRPIWPAMHLSDELGSPKF